jgi:hypothetical protein
MHAYCVISSINDFADGWDLSENGPPPKDEMLRVAHRIAASIADLHHYDDLGRATIVHHDLHLHQWIMIHDEYYLNDFNDAILLTWSRKTNSTIPVHFDEPSRVSVHVQPVILRFIICLFCF